MDETNRINPFILEKMKDVGLWGLIGPKEYHGGGYDALSAVVAMEELGKASASIAITLDAHWLCLAGIDRFGNVPQKKSFLSDLCRGSEIGAFAWTEPGAGSDAANIEMSAELEGDFYVLNGKKCFCTNGGLAGIYLVAAVTDPAAKPKGLSIFIVDPDTPGFEVGRRENKMGLRGSQTTELLLEDVKVPADHRLGNEGEGFRIFASVLNDGRLAVAGLCVGIAEASKQAAIKYSRERMAFGRPLASQQAVQFMIADMDTEIQAARLLACHAAYRALQGYSYHKEAAQAKYFASETAMRICKNAVQIHGGHGYTKDFPVERLFRDAKFAEIGEGASEILRVLTAKNIIGRLS
jgi:butyryl-CoA dehydrogenase